MSFTPEEKQILIESYKNRPHALKGDMRRCHNALYHKINKIKPDILRFTEKCYWAVNDKASNECKNKKCKEKTSFISFTEGYNKYCSAECEAQATKPKPTRKKTKSKVDEGFDNILDRDENAI